MRLCMYNIDENLMFIDVTLSNGQMMEFFSGTKCSSFACGIESTTFVIFIDN